MCTGSAPDRLYDQDPEDLETAIPDTYTVILKELISQCSHKQPEQRPNAIKIYNLARRVYQTIFDDEDEDTSSSEAIEQHIAAALGRRVWTEPRSHSDNAYVRVISSTTTSTNILRSRSDHHYESEPPAAGYLDVSRSRSEMPRRQKNLPWHLYR